MPILIQGLNTQSVYGTGTSRSQLYFSPYSYPNSLKLNSLLFPEQIFNENLEKLNSIIKRRKSRLDKKQILDKTEYQEGNIILATNVPTAKSNGTSQELKMTVQGVYYVKKVTPSHLRVLNCSLGKRENFLVNIAKKFPAAATKRF